MPHGFHSIYHYSVGPDGDYWSMISRNHFEGIEIKSHSQAFDDLRKGNSPPVRHTHALNPRQPETARLSKSHSSPGLARPLTHQAVHRDVPARRKYLPRFPSRTENSKASSLCRPASRQRGNTFIRLDDCLPRTPLVRLHTSSPGGGGLRSPQRVLRLYLAPPAASGSPARTCYTCGPPSTRSSTRSPRPCCGTSSHRCVDEAGLPFTSNETMNCAGSSD